MTPNYQRDFLPLIPPGFFRRYLDTMVGLRNECPLPFHFLGAAVVMGQLLGLTRWVSMGGGATAFPNVNVLLISPAGRGRRGEGTKLAVAMAEAAGVNVFGGTATPQGLADELLDRRSTLLYVEELSMLLSKKDYQRAIIPFLTGALICGRRPLTERTRVGGKKIRIGNVNLSMIGTTAPEWWVTTMPREAYEGGFQSRFLVCFLPERDTFHLDIEDQTDWGRVVGELAQELKALVEAMPEGQLIGGEGASGWLKSFYEENEHQEVEDPRMEAHRNRRPANLLRLALLLACSDGSTSIEVAHLEAARGIMNYIEPSISRMYEATDLWQHKVVKAEEKVVAKVRSLGGAMGHRALVAFAMRQIEGGDHIAARRLLEGLEEKGLIKRESGGFASPTYWPPKSWRVGEGA